MTDLIACPCRKVRSLGIAAVAVVALSFAVPTAGLASAVDQECGAARDDVGSEPLSMTADWAQTFKAGRSGELEKVTFQVVASGGTSQVKAEVRATGADGKPVGSALATSAAATVSAAFPGQNVELSFSSPPAVTAGQSYALLPYQVSYGGIPYVRRCDAYANGTVFYNGGGNTWSDLGEDFVFATYVAQVSPGGGGQPSPGTSPLPPDTSTPDTSSPTVAIGFPRRNGRYSLRSVRRRFKKLRGRVSNSGGVSRVRVSVKRKRGRRCYWLSRSKMRRRSCRRPVYLRARGISSWKVRLSKRQRRALKPGRYTLTVRLDDSSGNRMDADGRTSVRFRVRRGR